MFRTRMAHRLLCLPSGERSKQTCLREEAASMSQWILTLLVIGTVTVLAAVLVAWRPMPETDPPSR